MLETNFGFVIFGIDFIIKKLIFKLKEFVGKKIEEFMMSDRRRDFRILTDLVAKIVSEDRSKIPLKFFKDDELLGEGILTDISKGGIGFIYEGNPLYNNLEIFVSIEAILINSFIGIRHILSIGGVYCVGAEFLGLSDEDKDNISCIIEKAQK